MSEIDLKIDGQHLVGSINVDSNIATPVNEKVVGNISAETKAVTAKTGAISKNVTAKTGAISKDVTAKTGAISKNVNAKTGAISKNVNAKTGAISKNGTSKSGTKSGTSKSGPKGGSNTYNFNGGSFEDFFANTIPPEEFFQMLKMLNLHEDGVCFECFSEASGRGLLPPKKCPHYKCETFERLAKEDREKSKK